MESRCASSDFSAFFLFTIGTNEVSVTSVINCLLFLPDALS